MNDTRLTVHMPDDLHLRARRAAVRRNVTLSAVVRSALENYLSTTEAAESGERSIVEDTAEDAKIRREKAAFAFQQQELQQRYPGEYVAIHEGRVIDHDLSLAVLHQRVVQAVGAAPILLKRVDEPITREFVLRSPRLERTAS